MVIGPVNVFSAIPLVARLFLGTLDQSRHVLRSSGVRFVIERAAAGLIQLRFGWGGPEAVAKLAMR